MGERQAKPSPAPAVAVSAQNMRGILQFRDIFRAGAGIG